MFGQLTTTEKLSRIKIQMMDEYPFWAYLILKLNIIEDVNNQIPEYGGMAININGDLLYKKEFISKYGLLDDSIRAICFDADYIDLIKEGEGKDVFVKVDRNLLFRHKRYWYDRNKGISQKRST